ncbi:potassium channel family protein [Roseococcus sp. YIM B11640]|uniref:potassium channel family protein n=1 Tax=Roseococcus sp. YIM B11640 TaxID=3133973 RepID=UPI003C7C31CD
MISRSARRRTLLAAGLTLAFMLLVALGVSDEEWKDAIASILAASVALGVMQAFVPRGLLFALALANSLAIYVCLFVVIGRAAFPGAAEWARTVGFLLPVISFVVAGVLRRRALAAAAHELRHVESRRFPPLAGWVVPVSAICALSLALPVNRSEPELQNIALILAMAGIGAVSARSVMPIVRLLMEIAAIMRRVGRRLQVLAVPIATYVSLFTFLAVGFGGLYRICDGFSATHLFVYLGQPARLTFPEALHFSIATLSTVGYGDIQPADDGIRLLAAAEIILGQLLLLFGFAEIMRSHGGERQEK